MTSKILLLIFLTLCLGCTGKTEKETDIVIIPNDDSKGAPKEFYFSYNFIIDTGNHIFYYQRPISRSCHVLNSWDRIPPFLELRPNEIIEIPTNNIEQFLKLNMLNSEYLKSASLASPVDTIKSQGFLKIISLFKDPSYKVEWVFRKTTIEENIVLDYKKKREEYSPDEIKWDSTKTLFSETIERLRKTQIDSIFKIYENSSR